MEKFIESRWYALLGFVLVITSGIVLYLRPQLGLWALLPSLMYCGWMFARRRSTSPSYGWAFAIFICTAAVGVWAAYDQTAAWQKFCLLLAAVLFYWVLEAQPRENLGIMAAFWLVVGAGLSVYYLLTTDFNAQAEKFSILHQLGTLWMSIRPISLPLPSIHPNDVGGLSVIASTYGLFFLSKGYHGTNPKPLRIAVFLIFGVVAVAFLLASSRGAFLGLTGALAIWLVWRLLVWSPSSLTEKLIGVFPQLVVTFCLLLGIAYFLIPLGFTGTPFFMSGNVSISRLELIRGGLSILRDFPFTGGGLESFPGLYSQYVLVIPYYSILHSHNMYLDVLIEQGVLGGISFLFIYIAATWRLLSSMRDNRSAQMQLLYFAACISLFTALFHGMVDDYLYGGRGTILAFVPAAMAALIAKLGYPEKQSATATGAALQAGKHTKTRFQYVLAIAGVFAVLLAFTWRGVTAQWFANLGAVKMAKTELANFPANRWYDGGETQKWSAAEADFQRALAFQTTNRTANHRLGLIGMLNWDFPGASKYLSEAYEQEPANRSVIKNLGYSYLWSGNLSQAQSLLATLPETKDELGVYVWWWDVHGRQDLAKDAYQLASLLRSQNDQLETGDAE